MINIVEISADCILFQVRVDLLSPSRVLILVKNQHSELLKFHTASLIERPRSAEH